MKKPILALIATFLATLMILGFYLFSRDAQAGEKGVHLSLSGMALTNSSQQGGAGPSGTTVLTHTDLIYNGKWWAIGAFGQFDKQGASETDLAAGPKMELHWSVFYLEGGWAAIMQRSFTDRSIAKQTGSAWVVGTGVRVALGGSPGGSAAAGGGFFMQFSYKYRVQFIEKQDSILLSDPIIQRDGYPLFGLGYRF